MVWITYVHPTLKGRVKHRVKNGEDEVLELIESIGMSILGARMYIKGIGDLVIRNVAIDDEIVFDCM